MSWMPTYAQGFLIPIFDMIIFFGTFFEINLWSTTIDIIDEMIAPGIHTSWGSLILEKPAKNVPPSIFIKS